MNQKQIKFYLLFISTVFIAVGCNNDNEKEDVLSDSIVVQGYVFSNEYIRYVHISKVNSDGNASPEYVQNAEVTIIQNDSIFELIHDGQSGYIQSDSSMKPMDAGELDLVIRHGSHEYRSSTTMPDKITNLSISNETIELIPGDTSIVVATISWTPVENAAGYCLFLRNIESQAANVPGYISSSTSNPIARVINDNSVELNSTHFPYYGYCEIYVSAVNQEFITVYGQGYNQSLISAPTNIENGWGIFTAFNGESIGVHIE